MSYVLPQVQVFQDFRQLPTEVVDNLNTFVFGPHYELLRYAQSDEKPLTALGAYDKTQDQTYGYPNKPAASIVDDSYVKLYGEDIWLNYFDINANAVNPVVVVAAGERNKLRAAPRITDGGQAASGAVTYDVGGYHSGTIALPEAYYILPQSTFNLGTEAGVMEYITTEDVEGEFDVPADATVADVVVEGPDGIAFDFDNPDTVKAPLIAKIGDALAGGILSVASDGGTGSTVTTDAAHGLTDGDTVTISGTGTYDGDHVISNASGSVFDIAVGFVATATGTWHRAAVNYFTVTALASAIKELLEAATSGTPVKVSAIATGVAAWDTLTATLTVALDQAGGTLDAIRAAILALGSDVTTRFEVSAVTGVGTTVASSAEDQELVDMVGAGGVALIPDAIKVVVYENTYVFKTANGFTRTAGLYKDVEIGDKLVYKLTPASTGIEVTGETEIVGMEADYTRPTYSAPVLGAENQATLVGDDLSAGQAVVAAGNDNQVTDDFDYVNTKAFSAFSGENYRFGDLVNGVLDESVTLTVTKAGLKGIAEMRVTSASGVYNATAVKVEDVGANAGQIYIGNGVYVDFVAGVGNPTGNFLVGDSYIVGPMESPFTQVAAPAVSGSYAGQVDTTYTVTVTRGGKFDRVADAYPGLTATVDAILVPSLSGWVGGDVDDEYILECVTGGNLITSTFKLRSQRGDNVNGITFPGFDIANQITVGASGLKLHMEEDAGTPTFAAGDYFVIVVRASRPKVQVTDSAGNDQEVAVVVNDGVPVALGLNGLSITFPTNANGGLVRGDVYSISATASAMGAVQTLVLADNITADVTAGTDIDGNVNLTPDIVTGELMLVKSSAMIPAEDRNPLVAAGGYNWEATTLDVTVNQGITLQDSKIVDNLGNQPYLDVYKMDMYLEYRALLQVYTSGISSITDITEVDALGKLSEDNPLRLGVQAALENSDGTTVYFSAVPSDDEDGWLSVLGKASVTEKVYAFAPLTEDQTIHALVQAHVNTMSTETNKRWRRMFVGREMPSVKGVVTDLTNPGQVDYKATVTEDTRVLVDPPINRVEFTEDAGLLANVKLGDTVRLQFATDAWGNLEYVTDTVAEIASNTVLYLANGLSGAINSAQRTEIYHTLTTEEVADAVAAISEGYGDQRVCHVFPGRLGRGGDYVSAIYGAASIAGLVSSVPPQQGLTNIQLVGYDDVPLTYNVFNQAQLDTMAESGTMIIMQETQGGEIFIRHQLTTAASDGNLNTTELSIPKNLDSISYYFAGILKPYIGVYNVTPELISVIRTDIQGGLNYLGSLTDVGLLGPQINIANSRIRSIQQHPTLKDRILVVLELDLPAPLNVIELHLVV
jgi:hypothetical protein